MPEGYTHVRTALRAARAAHYKVQCPQALAAGANGPDALFCFEVWKPAAKRRADLPALGDRMHEQTTGAFLKSLVTHVKTRAQIEYVLGFLSHYAADTVLHPYVVALCQPGMPYAGPGGHGYFEIALDSTLHAEDTGVSLVPAEDSSPLMPGPELADVTALLHTCLEEVYGQDIPVEYLADAFYHLNRVRGLFPSRHGLKRALFWLVEPLFGGRGFITSHVSPRRLPAGLPETWTDPFTGQSRQGGAFTLLRQAEKRSALYMLGALEYWMGKMPASGLFTLLGSMSYTQGRPTAESDPRHTPTAPPVPQAPDPQPAAITDPDPLSAAGRPADWQSETPSPSDPN